MYAYVKYVKTGLVQRIPEESLAAILADENDEVIQVEEKDWTEPAENAADGEVVEVVEVVTEEAPEVAEVLENGDVVTADGSVFTDEALAEEVKEAE